MFCPHSLVNFHVSKYIGGINSEFTPKHTTNQDPGTRDIAVRRYSKWQELNVEDETLEADFRKACDIAILSDLDLEQVYKDHNPKPFMKNGEAFC